MLPERHRGWNSVRSSSIWRMYRLAARRHCGLEASSKQVLLPSDNSSEDREKTAFKSGQKLFWFMRMAFGLRNAPKTSQPLIHVILSAVKREFRFIPLNDIIVFSRSPDDSIKHGFQLSTIMHHTWATLNLKKCDILPMPFRTWGTSSDWAI